jgi:glycosyltransferase involved in cell wall biosynthesis
MLLEEAVASVLGQTRSDLELVVVDDGSVDDTPGVLHGLAAQDARIRVLRNSAPLGGAAARNVGIRAAQGEYVAFIDDDTVWGSDKLEQQLNALSTGCCSIGVAYGPYRLVEADGTEVTIGSPAAAVGDPLGVLLRRNFIGTPTVVARRDLVERVGGFDERLPRLQDWDLWIRLAAITRFVYTESVVTWCRVLADGISSRPEALATACKILVDKADEWDLKPTRRADWYTALAHSLMIGGVPHEGRNLHWRAVRTAPWTPHRIPLACLATAGARPYTVSVHLAKAVAGLPKRRWRRD